MEFLVHITIERLQNSAGDQRDDELARAERERAEELARVGRVVRLWRVPGQRASWGLWDAPDATALHEALSSLPLWPWMRVDVHPLARHPSDPLQSEHGIMEVHP